VGYYQSWSAPWKAKGADTDLANTPAYVNVVVVSFAKPDCTYTKGSYSLANTGLQFSFDAATVKDAIASLKARQPNTRVLLAVGGATYTNFAGMNTQCIKDLVDDFGFDGADLDYEPSNPACKVAGGKVSCTTDAESVDVTTKLRAALPFGKYLLSTASWHVGMYGEGSFAGAQPVSIYTGVNLAMARCPAGQQLDLINIMAYDAGNKASTGFDWQQSYEAHRAVWATQGIALGVEVPPEAWGGNMQTLADVDARAKYVAARGGKYGLMVWSLHKKGTPSAASMFNTICTVFGLSNCAAALPY
jgi:chitinase